MQTQQAGLRFSSPEAALLQHWGYPAFRGIQRDVIDSVLSGSDTLVLMPTGGGKSLCYQVPALLLEGVCVVISPLIALMKDQVGALRDRGLRAAALYSGLSRREQEAVYDRAQFGGLDYLYLSPERLLTEWTRIRLQQTQISLLAVDEAHCISQWGHDFRPAYRQIAEVRALMPSTPLMALTATATPKVADDICTQLGFGLNTVRHQMSFRRPNLTYAMREVDDKTAKLVQTLQAVPGSAVVYTRSRARTRSIAEALNRRGIAATFYHAGLSLEERDTAQQQWLSGAMRVVVATNAFGMGIDKPDVRIVIHIDLPDSLEGYFQEAGRAGRDGHRSYALLLYRDADGRRLERQHKESTPDPDRLRRLYHKLGNYCNLALGAGEGASYDFDLSAFAKTFNLPAVEVMNDLRVLEAEGLIYVTEAVYRPAMLAMLATKEELYDYCLRNTRFDKLIQTILRTHHGSYQNFVYIRERELSKYLGMGISDIRQQFVQLQREKIIDYRPQGELPQLIWTIARMSHEHVSIDWKALRIRQELRAERLAAALKYPVDQSCRAQQLLAYFGEASEPCGRCDICVSNKGLPKASVEIDPYLAKVKSVLSRQALTPAELLDAFNQRHHDSVIAAVKVLLSEGVLEEQDAKLSVRQTESTS